MSCSFRLSIEERRKGTIVPFRRSLSLPHLVLSLVPSLIPAGEELAHQELLCVSPKVSELSSHTLHSPCLIDKGCSLGQRVCVRARSRSVVSDSATPWTVARQVSLPMGFSRQEYRSGLPLPSPGDLPDPGIKPASPALAGGFFTTLPPGRAQVKGGRV